MPYANWSRVLRHPSVCLLGYLSLACAAAMTTNGPTTLEPGLFMFPTARAYDGVGTVFAIDPTGARQPGLDLRRQVDTTHVAQEYLPDIVTYRRMRVDANGHLLFLTATFADTTRDSTVVHVGKGWREQLLWGDQQRAVELARRQLQFLPNYRFFLITETELADSIRYTTTSTAILELGGETGLKNKLGGRGHLSKESGRNYSLTTKLAPPSRTFRVAYKAIEIQPLSASLGGGIPPAVDTIRVNLDPRFAEPH